MKLSYNQIWDDAVSLARAHREMILAIAGAFIFLPLLAQMLFVALPEIKELNANGVKELVEYYQDNFLSLLLFQVPIVLGAGALLVLLLTPDRLTAGEAITKAGRYFLSLFGVGILTNIVLIIGLFPLVLPMLYLLGRVFLAKPAMMAEEISNPITALRRSFALSRGRGWMLAGIVMIVTIVLWIATGAASTIIGIIAALALPVAGQQIVNHVMAAISGALISTVLTILSAAAYRQVVATSNSGT
jgi:hypothetical protein